MNIWEMKLKDFSIHKDEKFLLKCEISKLRKCLRSGDYFAPSTDQSIREDIRYYKNELKKLNNAPKRRELCIK